MPVITVINMQLCCYYTKTSSHQFVLKMNFKKYEAI